MRPPPNALWLGGPPGVGKTTIARRLARKWGLRRYHADTRTWRHRDRAVEDGHPAAVRFETLTPAQRWAVPVPERLAMSLHTERGAMIVDDVRALPESPLILVEGTAVTPAAIGVGDHTLWLRPATPTQLRRNLALRGVAEPVAELYTALADTIADELADTDAPTVTVDPIDGVSATLAAVEAVWSDRLHRAPRAHTTAERRGLLRQANLDVVDQHHGYFSRPWSTADPATSFATFDCECAAADCVALVSRTIPDVAGLADDPAPRILAIGHDDPDR